VPCALSGVLYTTRRPIGHAFGPTVRGCFHRCCLMPRLLQLTTPPASSSSSQQLQRCPADLQLR
jgi:hypothetical protein